MKLIDRLLRGSSTIPDPRCTEIRYNGQRCKLPRAAGSDKCAIHQPKP